MRTLLTSWIHRLYLPIISALCVCALSPSAVAQTYCTPQSFGACANPYETIITSVTVGSVSYSSGCTGAYTFYGNVGHRALAGASNTLTVRTRFFGAWAATGGPGWVYAWIDYNNNGVFEVSERIMFQGGTADTEGDITTTFTPGASISGQRRMRIRTQYYQDTYVADTDPCYYTYGESEDYTVEISPPTPDPSPTAIVLANPGATTAVPLPVAAGTYDLGYMLTNASGGTLASVTANYTITGPQNFSGSVNWSGSLNVGASVYVRLVSNIALNDPLQPYSVSVNLTNSVGQQGPGDGNLANNSLSGFVAMGLDGSADPLNPKIYWVGGTPVPNAWFSNLTDVGAALTFGGILGAVEFRIRPGTYDNQMLIGQISQTIQGVPGSSASRPITFTSDAAAGGTASNVILRSANTALNNYAVDVNGSDFLTFRNMTFAVNTATATAGRLIWLRNGTVNISFSGCLFQGRQNMSGGATESLIYSEPTNSASDITITNNTFTNGDYAMFLDGVSVAGATPNSRVTVSGNTLTDFFSQGIYMRRYTGAVISKNQISTTSTNGTPVMGINLESMVNDAVVDKNRVNFARNGTGIRFVSNTAVASAPARISNNMINVGDGSAVSTYGLNLISFQNANIFHNTVNVSAPLSSAAAAFYASTPSGTTRIVNNIFYNRGLGYSYYLATTTFPTQSNWNNLFSGGATLGFRSSANWANITTFRSGAFEQNSISTAVSFVGANQTFLGAPTSILRGTNSYNNPLVGNVPDDVNDVQRMAPPYMGAHELVPVVNFTAGSVDSTCVGGTSVLRSMPLITTMIDQTPTVLYDAAGGMPAPSWVRFQWFKAGTPVFEIPGKYSGVNTMNLTIMNTNVFDNDDYSMIATVKDGSAFRTSPIDTLFYSYSVMLRVNEPVQISRQPISQVACRGGDVNLNVVIRQGTVWGYQWYKDDQMLTNGTNRHDALNVNGVSTISLTLTGVDYAASGRYTCVLTTSCGADKVETAEAMLYVSRPTKLSSAPSDQAVALGGTARFEAKVSDASEGNGIAPVGYEWYRNGVRVLNSTRISGASGSVLTIRNVGASDVGSGYYVKVTGACGSDSSMAFSLSIASISVNSSPQSLDVCPGTSAMFSSDASIVGASGLSLSHQWRKDGVALSGPRYSGTTGSTLTILSVEPSDVGSYDVVLTANPGSVVSETSSAAALTVKSSTSISSGPSSQEVCLGSPASMSVMGAGSGSLTHQWRKNGVDILGEDGSSLSIAATSLSDEGMYSVVVTGECGSLESVAAMLKILTVPVVYGPTESKISLKAGGFIRLAVATVSDDSTRYQWFRDGVAITSDSISNAIYSKFGVATGADGGKYYCKVSNRCGSTNSDTVEVTITTSATGVSESTVGSLYLGENEPNPFGGATRISYRLRQSGYARLSVSDEYGRQLSVLFEGEGSSDQVQTVEFRASDLGLSSGVYHYTLSSGGESITKKMIFVR